MGLNENQKRALGATLLLLETRLDRIERVIDEDADGVLYHRAANFEPARRRSRHQLIGEMRQEVRRIAERFDLAKEEQSAACEIEGTLVLAWESLEECRVRKLGAYGSVDPALHDSLDPMLDRLIARLFALMDDARGDQSPSGVR